MKLAWKNDPNNETGFEIQRLDIRLRSDDQGYQDVWETIGHKNTDETTFTDTNPYASGFGNGPFQYRVIAQNTFGDSSPSPTATVSAIGGPDVTQRLLAISADLRKQVSGVLKFGASPSTLVVEFFDTPWGNWDINPLNKNTEATSANSGVLPDGTPTVTAGGEVFKDYQVNYWLYGAWASAIGIPLSIVEAEVAIWRTRYLSNIDGADYSTVIAWVDDGYAGTFSASAGKGISGVLAAPAPPIADEGLPMWWYCGHPVIFEGSD